MVEDWLEEKPPQPSSLRERLGCLGVLIGVAILIWAFLRPATSGDPTNVQASGTQAALTQIATALSAYVKQQGWSGMGIQEIQPDAKHLIQIQSDLTERARAATANNHFVRFDPATGRLLDAWQRPISIHVDPKEGITITSLGDPDLSPAKQPHGLSRRVAPNGEVIGEQ